MISHKHSVDTLIGCGEFHLQVCFFSVFFDSECDNHGVVAKTATSILLSYDPCLQSALGTNSICINTVV